MLKYDERYICAYLCNNKKIDEFLILLNFYNEISRISIKTKKQNFLQIRLQWFIDAVKNLYLNEKSGVELVDNLLPLIKKYNIKLEELTTIIEARNIDKDYIAFNNINEYVIYCENTNGVLWQIVARIYGASINDEKAAFFSGTAFAIIGNIRNFKFNSKRLHYKLIFNKKDLLRSNKELNKEIAFNIQKFLTIANTYIKDSKNSIKSNKIKRLLLLNTFTEGYGYNIKKKLDNINKLNPYKFPLIYKIKFIIKYIFKLV